jgi:uncharacterized NAD-dependent epimerase/dehydratase family protein
VSSPRYIILADIGAGLPIAKTGVSLIRYRPEEVAAVVDPHHSGQTVEKVMGFGGEIPIVETLPEALGLKADRLLVGAAPAGGALPTHYRGLLRDALEHGLDLYSGMHTFLSADPELVRLAEAYGRDLVDLRSVPDDLTVPNGSRLEISIPVILTVGSDCNVGKMTTIFQMRRQAEEQGQRYTIAATGQTGRLIEGAGFAVDEVVSDFVAGASERIVVEAAQGADLVLVEGQGSLTHPFYSGVTLGLVHGSMPDAMILCHVAGRDHIRQCPQYPIPSLSRLRDIYEEAAGWLRPARVIGVSLATYLLEEDEARRALGAAREELGLPVEDAVRFPSGVLVEACEAYRARFRPVSEAASAVTG